MGKQLEQSLLVLALSPRNRRDEEAQRLPEPWLGLAELELRQSSGRIRSSAPSLRFLAAIS